MPHRSIALVVLLAAVAGCAPTPSALDARSAADEVTRVERAFAKSMADRDLEAFMALVSADAVFFSGPTPLHGKAEVREWWARYFEGAEAPFSWDPDAVEALASGDLALSTGPVRDPSGKAVARYLSIWRREPPGVWRIVFDRGGPLEEPPR
jgi:ketosteroid isomerase-like protein